MGPRGGGGGFGFAHMIVGMMSAAILFALFVALVLLALKFAMKKGWIKRPHRGPHEHHGHRSEPGAPQQPQPGPSDAHRILDERLARGEIEVDDYKLRRDALSGNSYPPFNQPPAPPVDHSETRIDEHPPHVPPQP